MTRIIDDKTENKIPQKQEVNEVSIACDDLKDAYSREVEEAINTYSKVKECAVIEIMNPLCDKYLKAFIVINDDEKCNFEEILQHLKQSLADNKIPREIVFIDKLPRTKSGKILKRVLREQY